MFAVVAGKNIAKRKLKGIKITGGTNLSGGLSEGVSQMRTRQKMGQSKNDVASVMIFTDGEANVGFTDKIDIIRALQDPEFAESQNPYRLTGNYSFMSQQSGRYLSAPARMGPQDFLFFYFIFNRS